MQAKIHIQCPAPNGQKGDFLGGHQGEPISPVFDNPLELFDWLRENGWKRIEKGRLSFVYGKEDA